MQFEDQEIYNLVQQEEYRQKSNLQLIASENYASIAVMEAQGSVLTNKYAEGYPFARYYGGCQYVDMIESIAIERVKALFNAKYANVQPHSGSQANQAVMMALLNPGDCILGMSLDAGGHLTHGSKVSSSGKLYEAVHYGVTVDGNIDYDHVRKLAIAHRPRLIIAGFSCFSGIIDWSLFREIADEVGAYFMADIAHVAGLIASGLYPSPLPFAHVVTSTTHKTLRGPRGGIILSSDDMFARVLNSAVFPGIQGGPLMHVIAAKAICFKEALHQDFVEYQKMVLNNARALSDNLLQQGFSISGPRTENHIVMVDLRKLGINGAAMQKNCDIAGISLNKNCIARDPLPPSLASGVRMGTSAITTRGLNECDMEAIAVWLRKCANENVALDELEHIRINVAAMLLKYPLFVDRKQSE